MVAMMPSLGDHSLWKKTAFPLWRAMERHWRRNVVSLVSSDEKSMNSIAGISYYYYNYYYY